jgi:hypothetical protein
MTPSLFDPIRRKNVAATPEEKARQAFIQALLRAGYPQSAIQVEYSAGKGRFDVAVSLPNGTLWLLAECKAPSTASPDRVWLQAYGQFRRYQASLPPVLHFAFVWGNKVWCWETSSGQLLSTLPTYPI